MSTIEKCKMQNNIDLGLPLRRKCCPFARRMHEKSVTVVAAREEL